MPEIGKKIIIFCIIGGLCVSAYFLGYKNFVKPVPRTTDEAVYYFMAKQMNTNIFEYNTTEFALQDMLHLKKKYPEYFHKPLFKHPPLFTLMIVLSIKIFGYSAAGASFVPLVSWALAIALIYMLGNMIGGRVVGLLAAGFLFIDPAAIMSSQKLWMDTPLMFFMLLTVYAYWQGLSREKNWFFLLGGLTAGAAFLIKYPGILSFFAVILFVLLRYPKVFRNRYFLTSLSLPVLMALPWIYLNYYVYGPDFIHQQLVMHHLTHILSPRSLFLLAIGSIGLVLVWKAVRDPEKSYRQFERLFSGKIFWYLKVLGFIGAVCFAIAHIGRSLNFFEVPWVTWYQAPFKGQPWWFYFQRLLRFCFLYGFSYMAFFDPFSRREDSLFLMKLNAFLIVAFYIAWGNFQCRYILPALPFLMVLSTEYIWKVLGGLARLKPASLRLFFQALVLILIVLAVSKTMMINHEVSFTNNMCYF